MIALTQVTGPTSEPITLTEAKLHLKVDVTDDDNLITSLIKAARQSVEKFTWLTLFSTTYDLSLDSFPCGNIEIPTSPVQSITSITYYDTSNTLQTLASTAYLTALSGSPARVSRLQTVTWPLTYIRPEAVKIRFIAGNTTTAAIPDAIKQAMLLLIGHYYENREDVVVGRQVNQMPMAAEWLLQPYRTYAH